MFSRLSVAFLRAKLASPFNIFLASNNPGALTFSFTKNHSSNFLFAPYNIFPSAVSLAGTKLRIFSPTVPIPDCTLETNFGITAGIVTLAISPPERTDATGFLTV